MSYFESLKILFSRMQDPFIVVALTLSLEQRKSLRAWYHLAVCRFCRAYLRNLGTVENGATNTSKHPEV
jgi:hypothetical protein